MLASTGTLRKKYLKASKTDARRNSVLPEVGGGIPGVNQKAKSKVGGLLKKRASTRIGIGAPVLQTPQGGRAHPTAFRPSNLGLPPVTETREERTEKPVLDLRVFTQPDFDSESYVRSLLSAATEAEIQEFYASLTATKNNTSSDLQDNVFKNYADFVKISKEVANLDSDMHVLRGLLNDLRDITDSLSLADKGSETEDMPSKRRHATHRNSIANLAALHTSQMQSLWEHVEGSQKFLPAIPGRHVVRESPAWVELNVATWKPRMAAHLILLNDHLLVATRKHMHQNSQQQPGGSNRGHKQPRLVIQRCWPLAELELTDLAVEENRREDVGFAIAVRIGNERFVYRTDRTEEKKSMLSNFKRVQDELRRDKERQMAYEPRVSDSLSYMTASDPALQSRGSLLRGISEMTHARSSAYIEAENSKRNFRWLQSKMDELDVKIAHRAFEEAVHDVEKGRELVNTLDDDIIASELLTMKLDERSSRLAGIITQDLSDTATSSKKEEVRKMAQRLLRLGYEDRAREAFLGARTKLIKQRTRQIHFEGNVPLYIAELALIHFTLIRNTCDIYSAAFTENRMVSGFIKWAKVQVEAYSDLFARQLYSFGPDTQEYKASVAATKKQCEILKHIGLDFEYLLEGLLRTPAPEVGGDEGGYELR
ncbi:hypothetical protein G7K_3595-t1 [Saitoella complicata NRRL Y-17804]|uniref:Exocyst complex component EXO84 n=1 Tax=Saitoella complicata (strain BCRC 22490 / CBS 7301 / JCM 7358 / NBRC 10748 / NRRL Y-17804) TaxID=698492 RepID=A0A0E9NJ71_SAICN|nr:hypothetical protein G7K_3595-t1 [Saitoella complicata NRRL Y-17804]